MRKFCERTIERIDNLNLKAGELSLWFVLAMISFQFVGYLLKDVFDIKTTSLFELSRISNSLLIITGSAYTLLYNYHLRSNYIYKSSKPTFKALIDLIGALLFLLPLALLTFGLSWEYVISNWPRDKTIGSMGDLLNPAQLKSLELIFFISIIFIYTQLTALSALSIVIKAGLFLKDGTPAYPQFIDQKASEG